MGFVFLWGKRKFRDAIKSFSIRDNLIDNWLFRNWIPCNEFDKSWRNLTNFFNSPILKWKSWYKKERIKGVWNLKINFPQLPRKKIPSPFFYLVFNFNFSTREILKKKRKKERKKERTKKFIHPGDTGRNKRKEIGQRRFWNILGIIVHGRNKEEKFCGKEGRRSSGFRIYI